MGFFSFTDCVTGEQIKVGVFRPVRVLIPAEYGGGALIECLYDGYGHFAGVDIFELFAKWNNVRKRRGVDIRDAAIDLYCEFQNGDICIAYPIKITYDQNAIYEDCAPSLDDPLQGFN